MDILFIINDEFFFLICFIVILAIYCEIAIVKFSFSFLNILR